MQFLGLKIHILLTDKEKDIKYAHANKLSYYFTRLHCLQNINIESLHRKTFFN